MIRTEEIRFHVGDFDLQDVNLDIARGEYFVLMGPPGSGKTVFLECLCGLRRIHHGRILIDGRDVTGLEPRERGIGYVTQNYALFPHLSVEDNISFGLRRRDVTRRRVREMVEDVSELLGILGLLRRSTRGLSGGERQRVALARAIVMKPKVLLLDEPVSALDESTREDVCCELRSLQRGLSITTIHVSHNREEAFSVADRAAVLRDGHLQQIGKMGELLRTPSNECVARFMRCENLLAGTAVGEGPTPGPSRIRADGMEFVIPVRAEGTVRFIVREEDVRLARDRDLTGGGDIEIPVRLIEALDRGAYFRVELKGAVRLISHLPRASFAELAAASGDELIATVRSGAIHVLSD